MHVLTSSRVATMVCALLAPLIVSFALVPFRTGLPDADAALVLVAVVVAVAAQGSRIASLIAVLSATYCLEFFLVRPFDQFTVAASEDIWTVFLLFVTGAFVSELAVRLRIQREQVRAASGHLKLLYDATKAIGTDLDVEQTARQLVQVAVPRFADFASVDLAACVLLGEEPEDEPTEVRRVAIAGTRENHPLYPAGALVTSTASTPHAPGFHRGHARIEADLRASSAWQVLIPDHAGRVLDYGLRSLITAPLRAGAVLLGVASFWRSQEAGPFEESDLPDAEELAAKAAVAIDNARRYTRERATALALQRSLLPQRLPAQSAVEVASRYLPAGSQAGVGGDWFDVIPLSGSRVALVVGDVVGHGINASATMGRLRTAVRTLADLDLPPDELVTHLDDLVIHLTDEEEAGVVEGDAAAASEIGATCLYAVYDPVSRRCALASAGHPLPVRVAPDGKTVDLVSGFVGPPLGLGGLPFESTELDLPEGSLLALYSDGLIHSREREIDEGLAALRDALATPAASLDTACEAVIHLLVPDRPADDVTLLLARTHALTSDQVASWDIPADPARVAPTRKLAIEQLGAWGLCDSAFTTELLVSELVTNAIRYGEPPIQLRLIRDRTLICEVSDASSTAPHLRRVRNYDEGGRGLLLVAQLSQKWGTRHNATGKTIWCEQELPNA